MTEDEQAALVDIIRIAHTEGLDTDLEPWNVMMRDDELVFSDPLVITEENSAFQKLTAQQDAGRKLTVLRWPALAATAASHAPRPRFAKLEGPRLCRSRR